MPGLANLCGTDTRSSFAGFIPACASQTGRGRKEGMISVEMRCFTSSREKTSRLPDADSGAASHANKSPTNQLTIGIKASLQVLLRGTLTSCPPVTLPRLRRQSTSPSDVACHAAVEGTRSSRSAGSSLLRLLSSTRAPAYTLRFQSSSSFSSSYQGFTGERVAGRLLQPEAGSLLPPSFQQS